MRNNLKDAAVLLALLAGIALVIFLGDKLMDYGAALVPGAPVTVERIEVADDVVDFDQQWAAQVEAAYPVDVFFIGHSKSDSGRPRTSIDVLHFGDLSPEDVVNIYQAATEAYTGRDVRVYFLTPMVEYWVGEDGPIVPEGLQVAAQGIEVYENFLGR